MNRDKNGIGGDERVQRQEVKCRGAIDQCEGKTLAKAGNPLSKQEFPILDTDQFKIGSDKILVGRNDVEAFEVG